MIKQTHRNTSPDFIDSLDDNEIFVFGSNIAGRHGKGAALQALRFGAKYYHGIGQMGQTYALPTKDANLKILPLKQIEAFILMFLEEVESDKIYLVTAIGTNLAGYKAEEIAPLFFRHNLPDNVYLPNIFWEVYDKVLDGSVTI